MSSRITLLACLALAFSTTVAHAQPTETDVFTAGQDGYKVYRIPSLITSSEGTLLAFCEGRVGGMSDAGDIDIVLKRSTDGGKTWSKPIVIWDDANNTCGNPAPVVDRETGTIWLALTWNLGSDHEGQIIAGKSKEARHAYMCCSTDDGLTWSTPECISDSVRKPDWGWYATGPGCGVQLTRGPYAGRLVIASNHSEQGGPGVHPHRSHVFWSDDHGKTWVLGGTHQPKTNESQIAELSDGSLLQEMRNYFGTNERALSTSSDGGQTWTDPELNADLDTPVCQASLIRYSWPDDSSDGKSRLLFSSPRGTKRADLNVWVSYDEGQTWPTKRQIYAGGSAYSCLTKLPDGKAAVLYEKDDYRKITMATFTIDWLEGEE